MNDRGRTLAIFAHKPVDNVVFAPRCEHWYHVNKAQGALPERYREMELLEIYDDLGCSFRPYHLFNPCLKYVHDPSITFEQSEQSNRRIDRITTPVGSVETHWTFSDMASHTAKWPVETPDDMRVMEYVLRGRRAEFDLEDFRKQDAVIGPRSAPTIYIPRVNIQRLFLEYMDFMPTIYALHDDRRRVEAFIKVIDETDEQMVDVVAGSPVPIINYGDNVDQNMCTPDLLRTYVLPAYHRRNEKLHAAGKFVHAHWDGSCKLLLPLAKETGMDGVEAVTPLPQGDVTLEETKGALGEMVLLDGIPATSFLSTAPMKELEHFTRRAVEMFAPNLILGISDEISPVGDIERVRRAAEIIRDG